MNRITFERTAEDWERVIVDGEHVGDLFRHPDVLAHVVVLDDDPRGPVTIHDRDQPQVQETVEQMVRALRRETVRSSAHTGPT